MKTSVYCCLRSIGKSYFHVPLIESLNGVFPRTDIRGHASIEQLRINTRKSFPLLKILVCQEYISSLKRTFVAVFLFLKNSITLMIRNNIITMKF